MKKSVYFFRPVGEVGPIKIGSSGRPMDRLRSYQIWSPVLLELVASVQAHHNTETWLHRHFLATWRHGEWFDWSEELQSLIDHVLDHESLPDWVSPPTNPYEYRAFLEKYPRGKTKHSHRIFTPGDPIPERTGKAA